MKHGKRNYLAGLAAEETVMRAYARSNFELIAQRWRGSGAGELDLILRNGTQIIFVEVKQSRTFARAAQLLSPAQIRRLLATASEFLGTQPDGQNCDARFDVALVDQYGQTDILENALAA